jgi:uncharacterized protein YndB with AHSA1/START domain
MNDTDSRPSTYAVPTTPEEAERGYTLTRTFAAPRALVWAAFTEPDQLGQWFGPAEGHLEGTRLDVRVGGTWSTTMVIPGMGEIPWVGKFLEVDEPSHLVMTLSDQGVLGELYDLWTIDLVEDGDRTELTLRQSGGHLTDEQYEQAKEGTAAFLERMALLVEGR